MIKKKLKILKIYLHFYFRRKAQDENLLMSLIDFLNDDCNTPDEYKNLIKNNFILNEKQIDTFSKVKFESQPNICFKNFIF